MKHDVRLLIPALLLFFPLGSSGQSSRLTSVDKVGDGVWMARTDQGSNASWFLLGEEVVAVDTGSDVATGKALLEKIHETAGKPVRFVVITHAHGDHAGGVGPFVSAGAQVICHESAAAALAPLVQQPKAAKAALLALSERLAFFGGPRRAVIYFVGPAHTAGDLVVLLPEDKVLFSGDVALNGRTPYMRSPDVNPREWENLLRRLAQLDVEKVVPGHGTIGTRQALADTFTYVQKVNELARMMVLENVPDDLIEPRLHQPGSGVEAAAITPDLIANIRAAMHAEKAGAATPKPTLTPKPVVTPAEKRG